MIPSVVTEQVELRHGRWAAAVVTAGGGIRCLTRDGRAVLDGYPAHEAARGGRGQVLAPWPNRLADARYRFGGRALRPPVDEEGTGSAIHGLVRSAAWEVSGRYPGRCVLALRLRASAGYPFPLSLELDYALADRGLAVRVSVTNLGDTPAPFGAGFHPYVTVGTRLVDTALLTVPAATWLPTDARGIPTGERRPVDGGPLDFRAPRPIGGAVLDHCLTDLARGPDGVARVTLQAPFGRAVAVWMTAAFGHLMVFSGDTLAPGRRRRGLAVEPMTCAPDAFNSGDGLRVLPPGGSFEAGWGITASG